MTELWLHKVFHRVIFTNINVPKNCYQIFKKEAEIDELPDNSTSILQCNLLHHYLDLPNE